MQNGRGCARVLGFLVYTLRSPTVLRTHGQPGGLMWGALAAALVLQLAFWNPAPAADPARSEDRPGVLDPSIAPPLTETETVRLVLLQASVTDRKGRPVLGLEQEDFQLHEDGVPQAIDFFATETDTPVALAFMLDVSGSMRQEGKLDAAKRAIRQFLSALGKQDRFGLICFADSQVAWVTEFTTDAETFGMRLDVQEAYGQTALYDALAAGPQLVEEGKGGRKAIILFTDGMDTASRLPILKALGLARRFSVPIYTIAFVPLPDELQSRRVRDSLEILRRFATETGGGLFAIHGPEDLQGSIARIKEELRFQYVIGYYPTERVWDGSFHRIQLETDQEHLRVRTRTGYYAKP